MSRDVAVSLFITKHNSQRTNLPSVLLDVTKVVTANNNSALHLGRDDKTLKDSSTNGNVGSEGALLVDVGGVDGGLGGLEAKADVLDEAGLLGALGELAKDALAALAEHHLSLVASLGLFCHFVVCF